LLGACFYELCDNRGELLESDVARHKLLLGGEGPTSYREFVLALDKRDSLRDGGGHIREKWIFLPAMDLLLPAMMDLLMLLPEIKSQMPDFMKISAAIALCHVDAFNRDRGLVVAKCLRHKALRLKGNILFSRYPLRFISTVNTSSQVGLKHCLNRSHFRAMLPTCVFVGACSSRVNRRVLLTSFCLELLEVDSVLALKNEAEVGDPQEDLHPQLNILLDHIVA
jgi:hypothetical protein